MKKISVLFSLIALLSLTGCAGTWHVAMSPTGKIDKDFQNVAKGKVHLYPVTQNAAIIKDKSGSTVLAQGWTPASKAEPDWVTEADLVTIFTERSKQALKEAGYEVSYGTDAPSDALALKEEILGVFQNPRTPLLLNMYTAFKFGFVGTSSHPTGEVYVKVVFRDGASGAEKTVAVKGRGVSSAHLTRQSGFDRSMNFALDDFQEKLIKAVRTEKP